MSESGIGGTNLSYSSNVQNGASLGVGSIVGESFSILMRHFIAVVTLAFVPTLIGLVISGLLNGWDIVLGTSEPTFTGAADIAPSLFLLSSIAQVVIYGVTTALLVQLAYDAKLARSINLGRYVGPAMAAALPIGLLSIAMGVMIGIGLVALVVPGLWVYAVFSMMPAAVVIEKVGFGGLGRSASLTKEYRWPIFGAIVLIGIVNVAISFVAMFIVGFLESSVGGGVGGLVMSVLVLSAVTAIGFGLSSIAVALIYARLREIKEGASVRDIAAVFD
jgi:hypothetical protein